MLPSTLASFTAAIAVATAAPAPPAYGNSSNFIVSSIYAYQPSGYCEASVGCGYYTYFTVNSTVAGSSESAYCWSQWSDNDKYCGDNCVPWSTNAPTGNWIPCTPSQTELTDYTSSPFSFHLYGDYGIGNYSLAIRQHVDDTLYTSTVQHISNTTGSDYTCQYDSGEYPDIQAHASGDCSTSANFTGFNLPVESTTSTCSDETIPVKFQVGYGTPNGHTYVVGNITELGSWDISGSHLLTSDGTQSSNQSVTINIPPNTPFSYRYYNKYYTLNQSPDGKDITWDCAGNHVFTTPASTCDLAVQPSGNDSDYFTCCTAGTYDCQSCGFGELASCPVFR
ncbi:hypothetical protein K431DRAFT_285299 [Polychaeton citri CBS 116435]|uniref:CBM20 domain-containing protein n=1 Tax=Polychaeton citri CBS 116435 TaxID=1314669 RepID=A0A9P4Q892_9PEZI|nr:hypothetical protein K431DRAFT_285299 [Polychaeton citri CBS 116435]